MAKTEPTSGSADVARARSAAYGLIGLGFRYPDCEFTGTITDPARWSSWPEVLRDIDAEVATQIGAVRSSLEAGACGRHVDAGVANLQETFNDLFGHAVRGRCPPYELEYGGNEIIQQASGLADVAGFYAAFGVEVSPDAFDRVDHVAAECEFMSVLCTKEELAIVEADAAHLDVCRNAQRTFLKDHLARWLPGFAYRVRQADPHGFYGTLAGFTATFVAADCRRFAIAPGPQNVELRPADPVSDTTMCCRSSAGCAGGTQDQFVQLETDPALREGP